jgi:hypothetical protein
MDFLQKVHVSNLDVRSHWSKQKGLSGEVLRGVIGAGVWKPNL